METGTDMTCLLLFGDSYIWDINITDSSSIPSVEHCYTEVGTYTIELRCYNSRSFQKVSSIVNIDIPITGAAVYPGHAIDGNPTTINITYQTGTRVFAFVRFGDSYAYAKSFCNLSDVSEFFFSHEYNETGEYSTEISLSNTVSYIRLSTTIVVLLPIENLAINTSGHTNISQETCFTRTITKGTHMTCGHYYGDVYLQVSYRCYPANMYTFCHTYSNVECFQMVERCYNYMGYFTVTADITCIQIPINDSNVSIFLEYITYGNDQMFNFTMTLNATNVTCTLKLNTVDVTSLIVYTTSTTQGYAIIDVNTYQLGPNSLVLECENLVSQFSETVYFNATKVISNLAITMNTQNVDRIYVTTGSSVTFEATIQDGSNPIFTWNYGDGNAQEGDFDTSLTGVVTKSKTNTYAASGYFVPSVSVVNHVSKMNISMLVGVEYALSPDLECSANSVTDPSETVTFTCTHPTNPVPDNVVVSIMFDLNGNDKYIYNNDCVIDIHTTPYTMSWNYSEFGMMNASIVLNNNVSAEYRYVELQVGVSMTTLTCDVVVCTMISPTVVTAYLHLDKGSVVTYNINWADGSTDEKNRTIEPWDTADDDQFSHSYTNPGIYHITVTATNLFGSLACHMQVIIQHSFSRSTDITFRPMVPHSLPPGLVKLFFDKDSASAIPTNATCKFSYSVTLEVEDIPMTFSNDVFMHSYTFTGMSVEPNEYTITYNCSNCADWIVGSGKVSLDQNISGIVLTCPQYITVGTEVRVNAKIGEGSRFDLLMNYGDSIKDTAYMAGVVLSGVDFAHTYQSPGNYTVTLTVNNTVSKVVTPTLFSKVIVQCPVSSISVSLSKYKVSYPSCSVDITISVTTSCSVPDGSTDTHCRIIETSDREWIDYAAPLMARQNFVKTISCDESMIGDRHLKVNCSNFISNQETMVYYQIQREIEDPVLIVVVGKVYTNDKAQFCVTLAAGSHVNFTINYNDGGNPEQLPHPNILNSTASFCMDHTYTRIGNYTVTLTACNDIGCFSTIDSNKKVIVQDPVICDCITLNVTTPVKMPNGKLKYDITVSTESPCSPPSLPFVSILYGDKDNEQTDVIFALNLQLQGVFEKVHDLLHCVTCLDSDSSFITYVNISNSVSKCTYSQRVLIQQSVVGLTIVASPSQVSVNEQVTYTAKVHAGSDVTFIFQSDDGHTQLQRFTGNIAETNVTFTHSYTSQTPQNYSASVEAKNVVSQMNKVIDDEVIVENKLTTPEFTLACDSSCIDFSLAEHTFTLTYVGLNPLGNMHVRMYFGDGTLLYHYMTMTPFLAKHTYLRPGEVNLNTIINNHVSNVDFTCSVKVEIPITGVWIKQQKILGISVGYASTDQPASFTVHMDNGTTFELTLDYGEPNAQVDIVNLNKTKGDLLFSHTYSQPGTYIACVSISNCLTPEPIKMCTSDVVVRVPIKPPEMTCTIEPHRFRLDSVMTVSVSSTSPPTDPNIYIDMGDGSQIEATPNLQSPFTQTHTFTEPGYYDVKVNITNKVSQMSCSRKVLVQRHITACRFKAYKKPDEGDPATPPTMEEWLNGDMSLPLLETIQFDMEYEEGTNVSFTLDFGDATEPQNTSELTMKHAFLTKPSDDSFTVKLKCHNQVDEVMVEAKVTIISDLGVNDVSFNSSLTVNDPLKLNVRLQDNKKDICFAFVFINKETQSIAYVAWWGTSPEVCKKKNPFEEDEPKFDNTKFHSLVGSSRKKRSTPNVAVEITTSSSGITYTFIFNIFDQEEEYEIKIAIYDFVLDPTLFTGIFSVELIQCDAPSLEPLQCEEVSDHKCQTLRSKTLMVFTSDLVKSSFNCKRVETSTTSWKIFQVDATDMSKAAEVTLDEAIRDKIILGKTGINVIKNTFDYGHYLMEITVCMDTDDPDHCSSSIFYMEILASPLEASINNKATEVQLLIQHYITNMGLDMNNYLIN